MAQFDISKTVNNILSSRGDTAQGREVKVIRTAEDMKNMQVDVKKLAETLGLEDVFKAAGVALDVAEEVGNVVGRGVETVSGLGAGLGIGKRPGGEPKPQARKPKQIQRRQFSPFDLTAMRGAAVMVSTLMKVAEEAEGDGLDAAIGAIAYLGEMLGEASLGEVLDGASELVSGLVGGLNLTQQAGRVVGDVVKGVGVDVLGMIGLWQHALTLFIAHYPPAHEQIRLDSFDKREPNLVSRANSRVLSLPGDQETEKENLLNFWREDAQLNEHHGQWHTVYPTYLPSPEKVLNRNGELFAYMHQQMLARYDAERLGVGLSPVKPFDDDYAIKIPEGYDPGVMKQLSEDEWVAYTPRPAGATLRDLPSPAPDIPPSTLAGLAKYREALRRAAGEGFYRGTDDKPLTEPDDGKVTSTNFGETIEASGKSVNEENYGNFHGVGHMHFAKWKEGAPDGVMSDLYVAVRDPIFWRWHKHIDTIIQRWRVTSGEQNPHDFSDGPPVTVRNEDIIVCRKGREGLPADVDGKELGAKAFGHSEVAAENRWDTDFSSGSATVTLSKETGDEKTVTVTTTAELLTQMRNRRIYPKTVVDADDPQKSRTIKLKEGEEIVDYLSHEDFFYFIRLQNNSGQAQKVVIRIFLAPEAWVENHAWWIEMDRFVHQLTGHERAVVFRPARLSAVIRKPALGHDQIESTEPRAAAQAWCDCGWPYNLLLPRGTEKGLDFRLLVMLTKGEDLAKDTDTGQECTSMSYCGLMQKDYPDTRAMGYPFDQPLTDRIDSIISKYDNWASRKIKIRQSVSNL